MNKKLVTITLSFCFLIVIIIALKGGIKFYRLIQRVEYHAKNSNKIIYLSNYSSRHLSPIVSPFNHRIINLNEVKHGYSFLLGGHITSPPPPYSGLEKDLAETVIIPPVPNLLNNIKKINALKTQFFVGLGDIFFTNQQNQVQEFLQTFAYKLEVPFFNAPGNHDLYPDPENYRVLFGKTYFDFQIGSEYFIFLNTNRRGNATLKPFNGSFYPTDIDFEQLEYFKGLIRQIEKDEGIKHVFIFTHQNIWLDDPSIGGISEKEFKFHDIVELELLRIPKMFYWISGNPIFENIGVVYHKKNDSNITYINTNIANHNTSRPDDTLLLVEIVPENAPVFTPISLTNKNMQPIEFYDLEYVRKVYDNKMSK